jgi:hypothetical protein
VAPVFPLHGGLLIRSESSFSVSNSSGEGGPTGVFPYQGGYPPATRPGLLDDDGSGDDDDDGAKDGTSSDR